VPFDRQLVEFAAHRVNGSLVGGFFVATAAQSCRGYRRAFRYPHNLERENPLKQLLWWNVNRN
jgi:hypothetical protein